MTGEETRKALRDCKRIVVKIVSVVGITLGLVIPLVMIRGLVAERTEFRREARESIAQSWTGAQTVVANMYPRNATSATSTHSRSISTR